MKSQINFIDNLIWLIYLALAIFTPLLFSTYNSEVFELPKMFFVYFCSAFILTLTILKFATSRVVYFPKHLIVVTLGLFLIANATSTVYSIDRFTSIYGFPTRLNGGLLSQFAYSIIFVCALVNLNIAQVKKLILALTVSAFVVSLWGIPAHFGRDPTCLLLTSNLDSDCWQAEFNPRLRIFSTLGQPNWLASYLVLILPLTFSLILSTKKVQSRIIMSTVLLVLFLAFIFTNSRAGIIGLFSALIVFGLLLGLGAIKKNPKTFAIVAVGVIAISGFFGRSLIERIIESIKPRSNESSQIGGTESGQIRLIVWQGGIEIIKKHPILGTGPETFAYSYYANRPLAHNKTSEWNFYYNKAHNEFLNYFANLGLFGGVSYLIFIAAVLFTLIKATLQKTGAPERLSSAATVAAIVGYLVTIFFGFSTVTTQLVFFLIIAAALILNKQTNLMRYNPNFPSNLVKITVIGASLIFAVLTITFAIRLYLADIFYARAKDASPSQNTITVFDNAISAFPQDNPFYLADAAYMSALVASSKDNPENLESLLEQTQVLAQKTLEISPNNILTTRKVANAYLLAAAIDANFENKASWVAQLLPQLAPTDPQSYLTLAKVQTALNKNEEAKQNLGKALELKGDYVEAQELLNELTIDNQQSTINN